MKNWQEDHLDCLLRMASEADLFKKLSSTARQMGFEFCAYGAQMPIPITRPNVTMANNYPAAWKETYVSKDYLEQDPTVQHGLKSCLPLVWNDALFVQAPAFWEEARGHGIQTGWSLSVRDAGGTVGMLSLARSGEPLKATEVFGKNARLSWLSNYAHVGMMRFAIPRELPESRVILTLREREVLRWTAEGKTAYEIGHILLVSERTVNFHINNVVAKFGASNKTQAAVKAAALGLL